MEREAPGGQRAEGLKFFGAITASVSHELNNVISIIDQVGGLLQDILAGAQAGTLVRTDQLKSIQERIARQAGRGVGIIRNLNRFAHGVDETFTRFEVHSVIGNLAELTGRLADLKRAKLQVHPAQGDVWVTGNPFWFQQLVFKILEKYLQATSPGAEISIRVERDGKTGTIELCGPPVEFGEDWRRGLECTPVMPSPGGLRVTGYSDPGRTTFRIEIDGALPADGSARIPPEKAI